MLERLQHYIKNYSSVIHKDMADPILYQWVKFQQARIDTSVISTKEYSALIRTGFEISKEQEGILKIVTTNH